MPWNWSADGSRSGSPFAPTGPAEPGIREAGEVAAAGGGASGGSVGTTAGGCSTCGVGVGRGVDVGAAGVVAWSPEQPLAPWLGRWSERSWAVPSVPVSAPRWARRRLFRRYLCRCLGGRGRRLFRRGLCRSCGGNGRRRQGRRLGWHDGRFYHLGRRCHRRLCWQRADPIIDHKRVAGLDCERGPRTGFLPGGCQRGKRQRASDLLHTLSGAGLVRSQLERLTPEVETIGERGRYAIRRDRDVVHQATP